MPELIKLVRTYRLTSGLADQVRVGEAIFRLIAPDLRFFVFNAIRPPAADDVFQEVLKAIATSIKKFEGSSDKEFWAWCYRIARNKLNDQFKKQATDRLQPMPPEELLPHVETAAQTSPLSPADKHDLEYALDLLIAAKPECYDFLWQHFIIGLDYAEIAEEQNLNYNAVRMRIGRCLETAKALVS
jgi:RNA polymerase sigma factor (sigma-70 family)